MIASKNTVYNLSLYSFHQLRINIYTNIFQYLPEYCVNPQSKFVEKSFSIHAMQNRHRRCRVSTNDNIPCYASVIQHWRTKASSTNRKRVASSNLFKNWQQDSAPHTIGFWQNKITVSKCVQLTVRLFVILVLIYMILHKSNRRNLIWRVTQKIKSLSRENIQTLLESNGTKTLYNPYK